MALGMTNFEIRNSVTSQMKLKTGSLDYEAIERLADVLASVMSANNSRIEKALRAAGVDV